MIWKRPNDLEALNANLKNITFAKLPGCASLRLLTPRSTERCP